MAESRRYSAMKCLPILVGINRRYDARGILAERTALAKVVAEFARDPNCCEFSYIEGAWKPTYPIITRGCLAGSGSAFRINSRTSHGTLPSPNRRNPRFAASRLSPDQPK